MLGNVSPYRPPSKEGTEQANRHRPFGPPRSERDFKETVDERTSSKNSDNRTPVKRKENDSEAPSLFDLQKKERAKSKPAAKENTKFSSNKGGATSKSPAKGDSALKDQFSKAPLSSKDDLSKAFDEEGGDTNLADTFFQEPIENNLLATTEEPLAEPSPEMSAVDVQPQPTSPQPTQAKTPAEPQKPLPQPQILDPASRQQTPPLPQQQPSKSKRSLDEPVFETKEGSQVSKKDKSKTDSRSQISADKGEAALAGGVNSSIQAASFQTNKAQDTPDVAPSATIKDLAAQIVDRIQIMRRDGQTETIVTLRHPPVLAGATLTLTASDNAKREFNISFANLSPDAKLLLDRKLTEDSLTATLERKGIVVHMVTTTTQVDNPLNIESGEATRDQQQQQQQQQQQKQKRFQPEEEEEMS